MTEEKREVVDLTKKEDEVVDLVNGFDDDKTDIDDIDNYIDENNSDDLNLHYNLKLTSHLSEITVESDDDNINWTDTERDFLFD